MKKSAYSSLLREWGFSSFLLTQFFSALNDNLLKWFIIFLTMAGMVRGASAHESSNLDAISNLFILPSLLFTGLAGWCADRYRKRSVLISTKAFEMGVMLLAWLALRRADFGLQLAVLFLLATQFTFFGPSKYGVLPELVRDEDMSRANGLVEMSTFVAILLGSALAGPMFKRFKGNLDAVGLILFGLAVLGSLVSLGIGPTPEPRTRVPFRVSLLWSEIAAGTRTLYADRRLWSANLGVAAFWFLGVLFQLAVVLMGKQTLHLDESGIAGLGVALALGIGLGSLLAGRLSGEKVELGLVPLGALGMGFAALVLGAWGPEHPQLVLWALGTIGVGGGLFVVPLNALLQQKAAAGEKGRIQAANNFLSTLAMIAAALLLDLMAGRLGLAPERVLWWAGLVCFAMIACLVAWLPEFGLRCRLWLAVHTVWRLHVQGLDTAPKQGPALLLCEGAAPDQGLLIQACIQRSLRFLVPASVCGAGFRGWLWRRSGAIAVGDSPGAMEGALEHARGELQAGHVVCLGADFFGPGQAQARRTAEGLSRDLSVPLILARWQGSGHTWSVDLGRPQDRAPEVSTPA